MRVNVYAEEMTDRIQIVSKQIEGQEFTGLRFYLHLPVTGAVPGSYPRPDGVEQVATNNEPMSECAQQVRGPFMHHPGDDDSAAVTFWGKKDLRAVLRKALDLLDEHYDDRGGPVRTKPTTLPKTLPLDAQQEFRVIARELSHIHTVQECVSLMQDRFGQMVNLTMRQAAAGTPDAQDALRALIE